jgi:hypothetical protein
MNVWRNLQSRSAGRKSTPAPASDPAFGEDLSGWLKEVAKRPWIDGPHTVNPAVVPKVNSGAKVGPQLRRHLHKGRELIALAVLTISYLQYYYLDVMVQVGSLPKVIVFVSG